jgi:hypothetical protein
MFVNGGKSGRGSKRIKTLKVRLLWIGWLQTNDESGVYTGRVLRHSPGFCFNLALIHSRTVVG